MSNRGIEALPGLQNWCPFNTEWRTPDRYAPLPRCMQAQVVIGSYQPENPYRMLQARKTKAQKSRARTGSGSREVGVASIIRDHLPKWRRRRLNLTYLLPTFRDNNLLLLLPFHFNVPFPSHFMHCRRYKHNGGRSDNNWGNRRAGHTRVPAAPRRS